MRIKNKLIIVINTLLVISVIIVFTVFIYKNSFSNHPLSATFDYNSQTHILKCTVTNESRIDVNIIYGTDSIKYIEQYKSDDDCVVCFKIIKYEPFLISLRKYTNCNKALLVEGAFGTENIIINDQLFQLNDVAVKPHGV